MLLFVIFVCNYPEGLHVIVATSTCLNKFLLVQKTKLA